MYRGTSSASDVESPGSWPAIVSMHERAVGGRAGHRADLVEARGEGHEAAAADAAVGGLEAGDAAQAGRLADRAARVGADRHGRHVGGHAGGRAAARAARGPREIPGIVHRAEGGVFVRAAHRELVHVRLADDHGVGLPQPGHHVGVVRRPEAGEHLRGAGRGLVGRAERVLHARRAGRRVVPSGLPALRRASMSAARRAAPRRDRRSGRR